MSLLAVLIAAQITRVAGAVDGSRPFALDLELGYTHLKADTTISRERATASGILLGDELEHTRTLDALELRIAAGLWRGFEIHLIAPFAFRDGQDWHASAGGTLANNTIDVSGCGAPGRCTAVQPIGTVPGASGRSGMFDPTLGIAWSPVREDRDPQPPAGEFPQASAVATWVIGLDYTIPIGGKVDDPTRVLVGTSHPEERQAHVLTAWTAFSRRIGRFDPYLKVEGALPFATGKAYDNCEHPELLADVAVANCAGSWKGQTGYRPPFEAAVTVGSELVGWEDRALDRRFSFDLRAGVRWHSPSRGYSQVTDLLGKLTYSDEYLTSTGEIAFYGRIARRFYLRVAGLVGLDSAHYLTHEDIGEDKDGDGNVTISQGSGAAAPDQNPNYDFRLDPAGRRLHAEPSLFWGISGTFAVAF